MSNEVFGYRALSVDDMPGIDRRSVALARTNMQQGFMWLVRSIAQPDSF
jgi:hypothetical protein